ncbi:ABC transporter ATP-binding protein [Halalkalibacter oceani]|uniref:ABC transporter ATP-binding protein n=1 Tax=Halalkalibacter oceani TaxID=1653776 RepID=UPI0033983A3A
MGSEIVIDQIDMEFLAQNETIKALSNINLNIPAGKIVSLLGPSGCGKSTLIRLISDLLIPTGGKIVVDGNEARQARLNRDFGIIFQKPTLLEWRSVLDNVALPLEFLKTNKKERKNIAMEQLRIVGLEKFAKHYPWQLSGGMQQRVAIARALTYDPPILLMDEPFSALDEFTKEKLHLEVIRIQERTKKTIVFVTHSIPEAVFLSHRIIVLSAHPGRVNHIVDVEFSDSARTLSIRDDLQFHDYVSQVRNCFNGGAIDEG